MSTLVELRYAPLPRSENEFLAFIPNAYNPRRPMPINLTHEEIMLVYDTQTTGQQQIMAEERDLYGGSVNPLPPDWYALMILFTWHKGTI